MIESNLVKILGTSNSNLPFLPLSLLPLFMFRTPASRLLSSFSRPLLPTSLLRPQLSRNPLPNLGRNHRSYSRCSPLLNDEKDEFVSLNQVSRLITVTNPLSLQISTRSVLLLPLSTLLSSSLLLNRPDRASTLQNHRNRHPTSNKHLQLIHHPHPSSISFPYPSQFPQNTPFTLCFLRHGQSTWNRDNRFIGWTDTPLTADGVLEARVAGQILYKSGLMFDEVHTSLLRRSIRTTNLVLMETRQEYIQVYKSWRLNERHYGQLVGQNKKEVVEEWGPEKVKSWR